MIADAAWPVSKQPVAMTLRRIQNELAVLNDALGATPNIRVKQLGDNPYEWEAHILGPSDSRYDGATFRLLITFPSGYPFRAPRVVFDTPIAHRNVGPQGQICLDLLKSEWSPGTTVHKVLLAIYELMRRP